MRGSHAGKLLTLLNQAVQLLGAKARVTATKYSASSSWSCPARCSRDDVEPGAARTRRAIGYETRATVTFRNRISAVTRDPEAPETSNAHRMMTDRYEVESQPRANYVIQLTADGQLDFVGVHRRQHVQEVRALEATVNSGPP